MTNEELADSLLKIYAEGGNINTHFFGLVRGYFKTCHVSIEEYYAKNKQVDGLNIYGCKSARSKLKNILISILENGVEKAATLHREFLERKIYAKSLPLGGSRKNIDTDSDPLQQNAIKYMEGD